MGSPLCITFAPLMADNMLIDTHTHIYAGDFDDDREVAGDRHLDADDVSDAGSDRLRDSLAAANCCDSSVGFRTPAELWRVIHRGAPAPRNNREPE